MVIRSILVFFRFLPTALPVDVFLIMPSPGGIKPLTCSIFDPNVRKFEIYQSIKEKRYTSILKYLAIVKYLSVFVLGHFIG